MGCFFNRAKTFLIVGLFSFCLVPVDGFAQAKKNNDGPKAPATEEELIVPESLFLSNMEIKMIENILAGVFTGVPGDTTAPVQAVREIRLGGVLFKAPDDWIIWLNGQRVTPTTLPAEVVGIFVDRKVVYIDWYDKISDEVVSIRIHPNQVYDIPSGILLPGDSL